MNKYSELSHKAQNKAIYDYIVGWKETHPDEQLSIYEAHKLCMDTNDDVWYTINGDVINE